MIYCISDIHGEYDRYLAMLERIGFGGEDTLYVLGDCIDRGPSGVDILTDLMGRSNAHLLMGNHEQMCLGALGPEPMLGARTLWKQNGGGVTWNELMYLCTPTRRREILDYLAGLPDHVEIRVGERAFYLVHAWPSSDPWERLWKRPEEIGAAPVPGRIAIVGHTPTCCLSGRGETPFRIWHGEGVIDIDCGCGSTSPHRRLGCLRLDDMAEFYV